MKRLLMAAILGLACAACGGGIDSYESAADASAEIMDEIVGVLEGVTDEKSAQAAIPEIEAIGARMADIAAQMQELPPPDPEKMQELGEQMAKRGMESQQKLAEQMPKLAQYPELQQALQNAMLNAK